MTQEQLDALTDALVEARAELKVAKAHLDAVIAASAAADAKAAASKKQADADAYAAQLARNEIWSQQNNPNDPSTWCSKMLAYNLALKALYQAQQTAGPLLT